MSTYVALLDGGSREEAVEVRRLSPGLYEVRLRGRTRTVSTFVHDFGTVSLLVDRRSHSVQLDRSRPGVVKVQIGDSTFPIELLDERRLRLRRATKDAAARDRAGGEKIKGATDADVK